MAATTKVKLDIKPLKQKPIDILTLLNVKGSDFEKVFRQQLKNHHVLDKNDLHKRIAIVDAYKRTTAIILKDLLTTINTTKNGKGGK